MVIARTATVASVSAMKVNEIATTSWRNRVYA
jgi:hypothetical protein